MSEIKRINTRAELEQKREHFIQCLATQDKQIPDLRRHRLCGRRLFKDLRPSEGINGRKGHCLYRAAGGGAPRPQHRPEKKAAATASVKWARC